MKYKGFIIDRSENDIDENYIIYDQIQGEYLPDQPTIHTPEEAKLYIDDVLSY